MDIKIGAVFSLAETGSEETEKELDVTGIDDTIPERTELNLSSNQDEDEEEEYFIANDGQWHSTPSDISTLSAELDQSMNLSTDSTLSDVIDQDCPPSLSMETVSQTPCDRSWSEEDMLPPVLEPEKLNMGAYKCKVDVEIAAALDGDQLTTRRKCTRIFPSYLVLTNIRKTLKDADRISYRKFKRTFKECTNMCKKIYFRRRLEAGKDVFNVKSPSKRACHLLTHHYMDKERKGNVGVGTGNLMSKRKLLGTPSHARRREKLITNWGKNAGYKGKVSRIERVIQHMPTDFKGNNTRIIDIASGKQTLMEVEEKPKMTHEKYLMHLRNRELLNLRTQIRMKRHANKCAKKIRKAEAQKASGALSSGTSFSGRKRKTNTRYGTEFALTNRSDELLQYVAMAKIERRLKKERRRMKEDLNCLKRRMSGLNSGKKTTVDVVIDNPEENRVKKVRLDQTNAPMKSKKNKLKVKLKLDTKKTSGNEIKQNRLKESKTLGDGVLIRDLPNENQLISGILDNGPTEVKPKLPPPEKPRTGQAEHKITDLNAYPYAKSLLKMSLIDPDRQLTNTSTITKTVPTAIRVPVDRNTFLSTPELEKAKAQALRIPESVQNLFKVKTEPLDTSYDQVMAMPPHVTSHAKTYVTTSVDKSYIPTVVTPRAVFKSLPPLAPAPVQGASKSPQKGMYLPTLIRQQASTVASNSLFINAGGVPVPVTLKTGPNGDKLVTVMVSPPSTTKQSPSITTSHKNLTNTTSSSSIHSANIPVYAGEKQIGIKHSVPPVPSQDLRPVGKMPVANAQQSVVINTKSAEPMGNTPPRVFIKNTLAKPAVNRSMLGDPHLSGAPRLVKIGPCQRSQQPETQASFSTGTHGHVLQHVKNKTTPLAQPKPSVSGATSAPTTVVTSQPAQVLPTAQTTITNKCKFYLVKVDDKNILIPMNPSTSTPSTAFVVNSGSSVFQASKDPTAAIPAGPGGQNSTPTVLSFPVHSSMESPTKTVPEDKVLPKPTATITPNVKHTSESGRLSALKNSKLLPHISDIQSAIFVKETTNPFIKEDSLKIMPRRNRKGKRRDSSKSDDKNETSACSAEEISNNDEISEKQGSKNVTVDETESPESGSDLISRKRGSEHQQEVTPVKDKAFTEAITDRDEKLRKLKELLKEKQKAVEEIRANRVKTD